MVLLLDAGCNINHQDHLSETALMLLLRRCIEQSSQDLDPVIVVSDLMLQYGADPRIKGCRDETAIMLADQMLNVVLSYMLWTSKGNFYTYHASLLGLPKDHGVKQRQGP